MNDVFLKSDELRVALNEHPELPMVVFCKWSCGTGMRVIVGEVFDSVDCPYCPDDFGTFTDRDDWKRKMETILEDDERCAEAELYEFCEGRGEIWKLCQTMWKPAIIIYLS